ncbi:MAG TPA: serine/threonine protein kinase, partial [Myxococcales bacterium]|nr:serine/threonine protein kinase [Myxococcales bacterium]
MVELPTIESEDEIEGLLFGGRYKAVSKLGEGGLGTVYKGIQLNLEQDVAIKILKTEFSSDEVLVSRFCNEARIYAKINNPHVVKIHEFGQDDSGHLYLVMEFLPGRDLMDLIRERGPLDTAFMVTVATQVVQGLQAAHALGIVHRDIKPDNIMIQNAESERPFSRLLDFGISKMGEEEELSASKVSSELGVDYKKNLTSPGEVTGTPLFMAPEQCRAKALDARTDIYSMGLVLYNMAYGVPPFQCEDLHDLLRMQVFDDPPKEQRDRVEGVPPELEEIILRCLRKNPEERYQNATELLTDLEEVYKVVSGPAMMNLLSTATNSGLSELEGAETDTEKAKASAAEICKAMGKAHRSFILYPTDNPIISQVTDELFRNLKDFTERYGDLVLNCAHFSMYLLTERVYDNPDLRTSFPFKLYTDGVRRLFFHEGLGEAELKSFIECLRKVTQGEEPNSDLVTLMWSNNFKSISYLTVEELTLESLPDADVLNDSDTVVAGADERSDPRGRRKAPRSTVGERAPAFHVPLSEEEQRHLQSLIDMQVNLDSVAGMARALLTVLSYTHETREVSQLVKVLTRIGHALIGKIDLEHLLPILKASRKLLSRLSDEGCIEDLQSLLDRASAPETVEEMIGWMKASESPTAAKTLSSYLSSLNTSAVPVIIAAFDPPPVNTYT